MSDAEMGRPESAWLAGYLAEAKARPLCTNLYCTTCGASEFRNGVFERAARAIGLAADECHDRRVVLEVVRQLASLRPSRREAWEWRDAVQLIWSDLSSSVWFRGAREECEQLLTGSWAGSELETMVRMHERSLEVRRRHALENSPEVIEARRAEKRRLRDERLAARRLRKQEIDRRWYEQHPPSPGPPEE